MSDVEKPGKESTVVFVKFWSADRGVFKEGQTAVLPTKLAKSLIADGVAEMVGKPEEEV